MLHDLPGDFLKTAGLLEFGPYGIGAFATLLGHHRDTAVHFLIADFDVEVSGDLVHDEQKLESIDRLVLGLIAHLGELLLDLFRVVASVQEVHALALDGSSDLCFGDLLRKGDRRLVEEVFEHLLALGCPLLLVAPVFDLELQSFTKHGFVFKAEGGHESLGFKRSHALTVRDMELDGDLLVTQFGSFVGWRSHGFKHDVRADCRAFETCGQVFQEQAENGALAFVIDVRNHDQSLVGFKEHAFMVFDVDAGSSDQSVLGLEVLLDRLWGSESEGQILDLGVDM